MSKYFKYLFLRGTFILTHAVLTIHWLYWSVHHWKWIEIPFPRTSDLIMGDPQCHYTGQIFFSGDTYHIRIGYRGNGVSGSWGWLKWSGITCFFCLFVYLFVLFLFFNPNTSALSLLLTLFMIEIIWHIISQVSC